MGSCISRWDGSSLAQVEQEINSSHGHSSLSGSLNTTATSEFQANIMNDIDAPSDDEDDFLRLDGFIDSSTFSIVQALALGHKQRQDFQAPLNNQDLQSSLGRTIAENVLKGSFVTPTNELVVSPLVSRNVRSTDVHLPGTVQ
ncbi:hypothetical protein RCL1_002026 [Eukaryota sp. TZLM3-RCL]